MPISMPLSATIRSRSPRGATIKTVDAGADPFLVDIEYSHDVEPPCVESLVVGEC